MRAGGKRKKHTGKEETQTTAKARPDVNPRPCIISFLLGGWSWMSTASCLQAYTKIAPPVTMPTSQLVVSAVIGYLGPSFFQVKKATKAATPILPTSAVVTAVLMIG